MKRLIRALAAASLATAAFAAAPALAHDNCPPSHHRPAGAYYPAPRAIPPPPPVRYERRELRQDYAELERARQRFYATWKGNPGKARKFERWYATRKAELDRKWVALARW